VGVYYQSYGWVASDESVSGLEDEYTLSADRPKLIYIKSPAPNRDPRLQGLLDRIRADDHVSYKSFSTPAQLRRLVEDDLALLLAERFGPGQPPARAAAVDAGAETVPVPPRRSSAGRRRCGSSRVCCFARTCDW
jgi:hypothetical protein